MRTKLLKRLRKNAKKIYWLEVNPDGMIKSYEIHYKMSLKASSTIQNSSYNFTEACKILNHYRRLWIERWVRSKKRNIGRYKLDI